MYQFVCLMAAHWQEIDLIIKIMMNKNVVCVILMLSTGLKEFTEGVINS